MVRGYVLTSVVRQATIKHLAHDKRKSGGGVTAVFKELHKLREVVAAG
jgi:hypothetical protein